MKILYRTSNEIILVHLTALVCLAQCTNQCTSLVISALQGEKSKCDYKQCQWYQCTKTVASEVCSPEEWQYQYVQSKQCILLLIHLQCTSRTDIRSAERNTDCDCKCTIKGDMYISAQQSLVSYSDSGCECTNVFIISVLDQNIEVHAGFTTRKESSSGYYFHRQEIGMCTTKSDHVYQCTESSIKSVERHIFVHQTPLILTVYISAHRLKQYIAVHIKH